MRGRPSKPSLAHFGDPMDAAVVPLPEKIATDLDAFALDDGQVPKAPDMAYYLTAFPAHRTEVDTQDEEIWVTPIARVFAEADETVYAEEKCDRRTHIVFRRHSHDPLDGASGGPIWALTLRGTSEPPDVRLVASFIEANTDVGVAARIQLHMELASRNISDRRGE